MSRIRFTYQARKIRNLMHEGEVFHMLGKDPGWVWWEAIYSDWQYEVVMAGYWRVVRRG